MGIIKKTLGLGYLTGSVLLLSSCTESLFVNAYEFRNAAARDVGIQEAYPTVWNESDSLDLGRIYQQFGNNSDGYALTSYSGLFVKSISDINVSKLTPDDTQWSSAISKTRNISLQLGYMGLNALASANTVSKITFSLDGDVKGGVQEWDKVTTILNDPTNGATLRASIQADTQRLYNQKLQNSKARFWIVMGLNTAKNLTVTLHSDNGFNGKLDASNASVLANWIKVPNMVLPSISGSTDTVKDVTFKATDSFGWVAMCVPLLAYTSGSQAGEIFPDETTVLWVANTLHH